MPKIGRPTSGEALAPRPQAIGSAGPAGPDLLAPQESKPYAHRTRPDAASASDRVTKAGSKDMRVLFVGERPESVDFSDPALPPGLTAEKIHAGIEQAMNDMRARGWQAELCLVEPDESAAPTLEQKLAAQTYDCVIIGGGIRIPPRSLLLFEALINVVHKTAPSAAIGFNTSPENTAAAAARWLTPG